jgi:hypothetical protein
MAFTINYRWGEEYKKYSCTTFFGSVSVLSEPEDLVDRFWKIINPD